jgi:hypothetical protein
MQAQEEGNVFLLLITSLTISAQSHGVLAPACANENNCAGEYYQQPSDSVNLPFAANPQLARLLLAANTTKKSAADTKKPVANTEKTPVKNAAAVDNKSANSKASDVDNTTTAPVTAAVAATSVERPTNAAKGGIIANMVIDGVGYLLFIIGGALSGDNASAGIALSATGSMILTVGSFVGTAAYTSKTNTYRKAGFDVSNVPSGTAWALTFGSAACAVGGTVLGVTAGTDDLTMGIIAYAIILVGGVLEVGNFFLRRDDWEAALAAAPLAPPTAIELHLMPTVLRDPLASSAAIMPGLVLVGQF